MPPTPLIGGVTRKTPWLLVVSSIGPITATYSGEYAHVTNGPKNRGKMQGLDGIHLVRRRYVDALRERVVLRLAILIVLAVPGLTAQRPPAATASILLCK